MRNFGLQLIKLISLIRYYKFVEGVKIFKSLIFKQNGFYVVKSNIFKNEIFLRTDQSDPFIFEQVFCELQYNYGHLLNNKNGWIIDAGANIGLAAIYFSNLYPDAKIICLEPDAANFNLLKRNTKNYSNITTLHAALWHKSEALNIKNKSEKSAGYMIGAANANADDQIKSKTVIELMEEYKMGEISLFKIDIEGSEKELFEYGSKNWLPKCDTIITELHDWLKQGTSQVFFKIMADYDWITYVKGENIICIKNENN